MEWRLPVFSFLYFTCCNSCVNNYLRYYRRFYKTLRKRELVEKCKNIIFFYVSHHYNIKYNYC